MGPLDSHENACSTVHELLLANLIPLAEVTNAQEVEKPNESQVVDMMQRRQRFFRALPRDTKHWEIGYLKVDMKLFLTHGSRKWVPQRSVSL